jgi:hypothetical protein
MLLRCFAAFAARKLYEGKSSLIQNMDTVVCVCAILFGSVDISILAFD